MEKLTEYVMAGADPNMADYRGSSLLHVAAGLGRLYAVRMERGGGVLPMQMEGWMVAAGESKLCSNDWSLNYDPLAFLKVELLVEAGADVFVDDKTQDIWGSKAIDDAKTFNHSHVVAYLEPLIAMVRFRAGSRRV